MFPGCCYLSSRVTTIPLSELSNSLKSALSGSGNCKSETWASKMPVMRLYWFLQKAAVSVKHTCFYFTKQPAPGWPIGNLILQICFWVPTLALSGISSIVGGSDTRKDEDGWNRLLTAPLVELFGCGMNGWIPGFKSLYVIIPEAFLLPHEWWCSVDVATPWCWCWFGGSRQRGTRISEF